MDVHVGAREAAFSISRWSQRAAEPMKFRDHFLHRGWKMKVLLIFLLLVMPMRVVGITEVETLERGKEAAHDLGDEREVRMAFGPSSILCGPP
jgi:hypothetical protein